LTQIVGAGCHEKKLDEIKKRFGNFYLGITYAYVIGIAQSKRFDYE